MATQKEPVKYKFGENELDLQQYIQTLDNNVKAYMDAQKWNENQRKEFMNAYSQYYSGLKDQLENGTSRFSTNGFGTIIDSQSQLSNKDNDDIDPNGSEYYYDDKGNRITTDDYNLLKEKKQKNYKTFSANRHVATYFDKIGRSLIGKNNPSQSSTPEDNTFNMNKHGFTSYWTSRYNPTGTNFDGTAILELDPYDETTKTRANTNRQKRLESDMNDYIAQLGDYDFSKSNFKTKEGYVQFLQSLLPKIADGLNGQDALDLGSAGITREFLTPFISTDKVVSRSAEQIAADEAKAKQEQQLAEQKAKEEAMQAFIDQQRAIYEDNKGDYYDPQSYYDSPVRDNTFLKFDENGNIDFLNQFKDPNGDIFRQKIDNFINDPYNPMWGNERYPMLQYLTQSGIAQPIPENVAQFTGLSGFYYIPRVSDITSMKALVYNPQTNQLLETFLGNTGAWDSVMNNWKIQQGYINPTNIYMRKEGGTIEKLQQGGTTGHQAALYLEKLRQEKWADDAKKNGRTVNEQKAADRYINKDNASFGNPDAGWKAEETARLIGGAADIASAVSAWLPGYGTAASLITGLGSTALNLFADIKDESVNGWDVWKNAGLNLGMDLAGLIPGGGAAGKFAKIGKSLVNLAPKMIAAIGTVRGLANAPVYIESWNKMMNSEEKLTAQDWTNIMQSIQVVLGPAAAVGQYAKNKGYYGNNKATKAARADVGAVNSDKIAVEMLDKNGNKKTVLFEGEDVADIKAARESGDMKALEAATIKKFKDLDGYKFEDQYFGRRKAQLSWDPTKWSPVGHADMIPSRITHDVTTRQGVDFVRTRALHDDITKMQTPGQRWSNIDDAYITTQLEPLKSRSDTYERVLSRKQKAIQDLDAQITQNNADLNVAKKSGKTASQLEANIKAIETAKNDGSYVKRQQQLASEQTQLQAKEIKLQQLEAEIADLKAKEIRTSSATKAESIRRQIEDAKADRDLLANEINTHKTNIDDHTKWLDDMSDSRLPALQAEHGSVKALEDVAANLNQQKSAWDKYKDTGHTDKYDDFITRNPVDANGNITLKDPSTGREITRNLKQILQSAGIKYQQGGSLNIAKVRKFQKGGNPLSNVSSTANWYDDMFQSDAMKNFFSNFDVNKLNEYNNLQQSYSTNRNQSGYDVNNPSKTGSYSDAIKTRQGTWNNLGLNAPFVGLIESGKIKASGNSGDNAAGGYQDGYFGHQESLRHFGSSDSWFGKENELKVFQDQLKEKGVSYELDPDTGMYLFKKIETPVEEPVETLVETPSETSVVDPVNEEPEKTKKKFDLNFDGIDYRLPRALYADWTNKKITDLAKKGEKPMLQDPMQINRTIYSDLDAEMQGQRAAGALNSVASKPLTSDGNAQMAAQLEATIKGQEFINQGKEKSNQFLRASQEQAWQQEKENAQNRHNVAMQNRLAMRQTEANKNKYDQAYLNKQHEIWDTYLKELQFNAESKRKENKALEDNLAKSDISNIVTSDLATLAPNLDPRAVKLYQDVRNGVTTVSKISENEADYQLFMQAAKEASRLETDRFAEYKGLRRISAKEGTKIRLANIRTKQKNKDRFAKQIKSDLDRNEKALARLSKSIYSYIKGKMV